MFPFYKKLPIRNQLLTVALCMILVMLFIILFFYFQITEIYMKRNDEYTKEIILQIRRNVSSHCDVLSNITTSIAYNSLVQEYLVETEPVAKFELYAKVENLFNNMAKITDGVYDITIIGNNNNVFDMQGCVDAIKDYMPVIPERVDAYYYGIIENDIEFNGNRYFLIGTNIYGINKTKYLNNQIGFLAVLVDPNVLFKNMVESTYNNTNTCLYLTDRNNHVFFTNEPDMSSKIEDMVLNETYSGPYTIKLNNKQCIVQQELLPEIGGRVVSVVFQDELFQKITEVRKTVLLIFAIAIVVLSVPFSFVLNNLLKPMNKFMQFINSIRSGNLKNLKKRLKLQGCMEMNIMAKEFNSMLNEINQLTKHLVETNSKLYEAELNKKQSELAYLRSQINPHFLYNTLESIKGIAAEEGVTDIIEMTQALGNLFKFSVKGDSTVLLAKELKIIKSYVKIQMIRFKGRFTVSYCFTEEALECMVPKVILQPIVENAIYHGLEVIMGTGCLVIEGMLNSNNELVIKVCDNGAGMDKNILEKIQKSLEGIDMYNNLDKSNEMGVGILNVNNRIRLMYGEEYGIKINSQLGKGTDVIIKIPAKRDKNV